VDSAAAVSASATLVFVMPVSLAAPRACGHPAHTLISD
jgi:hypothetical protein